MQRVAVCLTISLAGGLPVWAGAALTAPLFPSDAAQIVSLAGHSIDLSAYSAFRRASSIRQPYEPFVFRAAQDAVSAANGGAALGPVPTEFTRTSRKHAHFATFKINGVTVFGAGIGGSVDGRSANVVFSWPTSP